MSRLLNSISDVLKTASGYTVSQTSGSMFFWFKPIVSSGDNNEHWVVKVFNGVNKYFQISKGGSGDNRLYCGWYNGGIEGRVILVAGAYPWVVSNWNSFLITWEGTFGYTRIWINGIFQGEFDVLTARWDTSAAIIRFGNAVAENVNAQLSIGRIVVWSTDIGGGTYASVLHNRRTNPATVESASVIDEWKVLGSSNPEPNGVGGRQALNVTGTTQDEDPIIVDNISTFANQKNMLLAHHDKLLSY